MKLPGQIIPGRKYRDKKYRVEFPGYKFTGLKFPEYTFTGLKLLGEMDRIEITGINGPD